MLEVGHAVRHHSSAAAWSFGNASPLDTSRCGWTQEITHSEDGISEMRESGVGMIVFSCPVTGGQQFSEIETSSEQLARLGRLKLSLWCSHCKAPHAIVAHEITASAFGSDVRVVNAS